MQQHIVHGACADAVIYTVDNPDIAVDDYAVSQVKMICDHKSSEGSQIRVMPDVHPGKVGPIGLTMTVGESILPQLVGIDIGCGMTLSRLQKPRLEYQKLDAVIREYIPTGFNIHDSPRGDFEFDQLACARHIQRDKALCSLGTLGGGNHFIEIDRDEEGNAYIIIHSGSRHLGKEVCEYYCREGQRVLNEQNITEPYEMTWLSGALREDYLKDVQCAQAFAALNRETMLKAILKKMKWKPAGEIISCCHNYIDGRGDKPILRKGAISAQKDEEVIIPIHMKDGVLLGRGKGNPDWNMSAPHGSGRLYKREDVQNLFSVSAYKKAMNGIYSSCIDRSTLDESPFCYRGMEDMQKAVADTVQVEHILRPLYNYKHCGER